MASKLNIFTKDWCDMVFANKNKEYGAYILRKDADGRHRRSFIIVVICFSLATGLPTFINRALNSGKDRVVEVTKLSDIKIEQVKQPEVPKEEKQEVVKAIKFVPPVIKPDDEVVEGKEMMTQDELVNIDDPTAGVEVAHAEAIEVKEVVKEADPIFNAVEQMPSFPGGDEERVKYLSKNMVYPPSASENGIQGTVYVSFVVDRNGHIADVKVLRSVDPELDKEAVRVVKNMPSWLPGKQNGAAVRVAYTMPIKFVLQQ
jgi:protein TonB